MKGNLLSLDASSKVVGYSIFDMETKKLIYINYLVLSTTSLPKNTTESDKELLNRIKTFKKFFVEISEKYNINEVVIEQSFTAMFGKTNANTIAVLNKINFGIQTIVNSFGISISSLSVSDSRKNIKIKIMSKKKCGLTEKEQLFLWVENKIGSDKFPKKKLTRGENKGKEIYRKEAYDMSDSYIVGLGKLLGT